MTDIVQLAMDFAKSFHEGQEYAGKDYYSNHVLRVATDVTNYIALTPELENNLTSQEKDELLIIALLHDIVEDTSFTLDMVEEHFGLSVRLAVDGLTKRDGEEYNDYIARLCSNWQSRLVKGRDSNRNYLQCLVDKNYKRAKKYAYVLDRLEDYGYFD